MSARVLVVGQVAYTNDGNEDADSLDLTFIRPVKGVEQPVRRRFEVGEEWQPLDAAWLDAASICVIANNAGRGLQTIPTPEEAAAIDATVVEIGVQTRDSVWPVALLRPGARLPIEFYNVKLVRLRCRRGSAKCVATLYPE